MAHTQATLVEEVKRLKFENQALKLEHAVTGHTSPHHAHKKAKKAGEVWIGDYLLTRLEQLGVSTIFGVPGDVSLPLLDLIEAREKLLWVGDCNELNAAYAADGYSRLKKQSLGVVFTKYAVGSLCALNGIAGAAWENVPVLHLVCVPSTEDALQTAADGRYAAANKSALPWVHSFLELTAENAHAASYLIDRLLVDAITNSSPVYLTLPANLAGSFAIPSEPLNTPLPHLPPAHDPKEEKFVIDLITNIFRDNQADAIILVDAGVARHGAEQEARELVYSTGFPVFASPMGKTIIDENYPRYGGIYIGAASTPEVRERVLAAKVVLSLGFIGSDLNTGGFTYDIPVERMIMLHHDKTRVQYADFVGVGMKQLMPQLNQCLLQFHNLAEKLPLQPFQPVVPPLPDTITHDWMWPRLTAFLKKDDIVVSETGTANFGILGSKFPFGAALLNQFLWGSIGWSVGSALGAAFANRDLKGTGREILFVGDGSLQLTVQELSPYMKHGFKPIIFVLNNGGYTLERLVSSPDAGYQSIANWDWAGLLDTLGGPAAAGKYRSYRVETGKQLSDLLDNAEFASADKIQIVDVKMGKLDAPESLKKILQPGGPTMKGPLGRG